MKRTTSSIFVVDHAGYPFDVMVAIGASDGEVVDALQTRGCDPNEDETFAIKMAQNGKGKTVVLRGGQTVLRLLGWTGIPDDWGHLAHEIFHAVEFLMHRIGISLCDQSDEAYAYAIGNLTVRIVTELGKPPHKRERRCLPAT